MLKAPAARSTPWLVLGVVAPILALALLARTNTVINHDVAWLTVAADRMLAGGRYFSDFFEINMPLAIGLYLPARLLSKLMAWPVGLGVDVWTLALLGQALFLLAHLGERQHGGELPLSLRLSGLAWAGLGLGLLPGYHFAQREHLMMILLLPWALSLVGDPARLGPALRAYLAALAAVGCFIKPQFAALPFLLLLPRCAAARSLRPLYSLEVAVLLAVGIINAVVVNLVFPEWWTCAAWARDLYAAYQRSGLLLVLLEWPVPLVALAAVAPLLVAARTPSLRASAWPLLLIAAYGTAAYLLQFKGWSYQFLPVTLAVFLLCGCGLGILWLRDPPASVGRRVLVIAGALLALFLLGTSTREALSLRAVLQHAEIVEALSPAQPGDQVFVFSTTMVPAFPIVVEKGYAWASRLPGLGPLAGIEARSQADTPEASERRARYAAALRGIVLEDFMRYAPRLVLVDLRRGQFGLPAGYRILDFFTADPRFSAVWQRYRKIGTSPSYEIYLR